MAREFRLRDSIIVNAPIERCFALSTSVAVVELDLRMRPVAGRITGQVQAGDTVMWRGWKFGLPRFHESLIDGFDAPVFFRDRMRSGGFSAFEHEHHFSPRANHTTLLSDEIRFTLPWGFAGALAGRAFIAPHIAKTLRSRMVRIKQMAEGEELQAAGLLFQ